MRINQNIAAFNSYNNLNQTQNRLNSSLEKLSSGFRINRAADDASGLVNSENLRAQIGGLKVATRNAQDAISLVQTAEGAQTEVHSILQRMRDLVVQSGNLGTNDSTALKAAQDEIGQLRAELDRINDDTQFGTTRIFTEFGTTGAVEGAGANDTYEALTVTADSPIGDLTDLNDGTLEFSVNGATYTATFGETEFDGDSTLGDVVAVLNAAVDGEGDALSDAGAGTWRVNTEGADPVLEFHAAAGETQSTLQIAETPAQSLGFTGAVDATADLDDSGENGENGGNGEGATFQVGANAEQSVTQSFSQVSAAVLGVGEAAVNVNPAEGDPDIDGALEAIDAAITTVSENRAELGAFQNRMESTIRNLSVAVENLSAAESRIRDTDMALEMVEFTRNQILSQAGTAMLAQANMAPQSVLSLLG